MSEVKITKEKNIITMEIPSGKATRFYRFNIATGQLTGKRGKPVKNFCSYRAIKDNIWGKAFCLYRQYSSDYIFPAIELLVSLGISERRIVRGLLDFTFGPDCIARCRNIYTLRKFVPKWVKEHSDCIESYHYWVDEFVKEAVYLDGKAERGRYGKELTLDEYSDFRQRLDRIPTNDELEIYGYYLQHGRYYSECNISIAQLTVEYLKQCADLEKKPQKCADMIREFTETIRTYTAMKQIIDQKKFVANYKKHSRAWDFEYGDFTIVVPKEGKDLVREGQEMRHCVGGYIDRVVNGECSVVFVRHKDTPDKCYITCQVYPNGKIGQYYLAYDRYISSDEDKAFQQAFQEHLNKVWENN